MNDEKLDQLYNLLPAIYRMRDYQGGEPLRALLRVISEQVSVVEDDIGRLYENWFIETCEDWVVPYIGDLVGYKSLHERGEPGTATTESAGKRGRILIPRRDAAATVRNRRRKGTLALLEELARDAAGWPARAVEFFKLLGWTQHLNHCRTGYARTTDLRNNEALAQIDGPFDSIAHTIDVRRLVSIHTPGRYNIPTVGLFVWRLKPYTITKVPACCVEEAGPQCYTFSVLGNDTQLIMKPEAEPDPTHIAEEKNLPVPIRRWSFDAHAEQYFGEGKSIEIWAPGWGPYDPAASLPLEAIVPADLSDWSYRPLDGHVAVDPVLGRMVFPPSHLPKKGVRVSYRYCFSDDIGGGEYDRPRSQPGEYTLVRVGEGEEVKRIGDAWARIQQEWAADPEKPQNGVIEISDSGVYVEQLLIDLKQNQYLQIRAANRVRPLLRLLDWQTDMPDALSVTLSPGSSIIFDGLMIAGRSVSVRTKENDRVPENTAQANDPAAKGTSSKNPGEDCQAEVSIRHCTLVPGWNLDIACDPKRPAEPSLELFNARARVCVEHSIVGSIQVNEDQVRADPISISITDTILDATSHGLEALGAPGRPVAHAILTVRRCTVFGEVLVHAIELAENSIFTNCLSVARRQLGCMRFCYVPEHCRTPRRYHCQPDRVKEEIEAKLRKDHPNVTQEEVDAAKERERDRVRPQFNSVRYGQQGYAQLAGLCAGEIKRGADDESEMGAFHDLYNPQREANLRARLDEYTPAGMEAGIILAT
jgi:hypothetical protein